MKKKSLTFSMLAIVLFLCYSCTKQDRIGQYVYVDCFHTIHIDRKCVSTPAENPQIKEERLANIVGVHFIDTCDLCEDEDFTKFCPKCVDEDAYKHLKAIMKRNQETIDSTSIQWVQ